MITETDLTVDTFITMANTEGGRDFVFVGLQKKTFMLALRSFSVVNLNFRCTGTAKFCRTFTLKKFMFQTVNRCSG